MKRSDTFKHIVGRPTLSQGVAVRRDFEGWFGAPVRGQAREVRLLFDTGEARATLRRADNDAGSVQIRYSGSQHQGLREWLSSQFAEKRDGGPQLLEFVRVSDDTYRLVPIAGQALARMHLCLGPALHHNGSNALAAHSEAYSDLLAAVGSIGFVAEQGQAYYNEQMRQRLVARGWESDQPAVPDLPLRFDFRKGDLQVEVEFGNARSYYQDYLKFLLPFTRGIVRMGVLLVPTADFARCLCALGRRRASDRATREGQARLRPPSYSNMVTFDKVEREFEALRFILNMPLIVRGIDFWGSPTDTA